MNIKKFLATCLSAAIVCTSLPLRSDVNASGTDNLSPGAKVGIGLGSGAVFAAGAGALIWSLLRGHPFGSPSVAPQPSPAPKNLDHYLDLGYGKLKWRKFDQPKEVPNPPTDVIGGSHLRTAKYRRATKANGASALVPMATDNFRLPYRLPAFVNDEVMDRFIKLGLILFEGIYNFVNGVKEALSKARPEGEPNNDNYIADKYFENIAKAVEFLESIDRGENLAFFDPASNKFRGGALTSSDTLEETSMSEGTGSAAVNSNIMNFSYDTTGPLKQAFIPFRISVIKGARFYRSEDLKKVSGRRGGLDPKHLNDSDKEIRDLYNSMHKVSIFVTAFDKGQPPEDSEFRLWARNMAIIMHKLRITGAVLPIVGLGSFAPKEWTAEQKREKIRKWFGADGIFAQELHKYAPSTTVVLFNPNLVAATLEETTAYEQGVSRFLQSKRMSLARGWYE